jgi:hypothetical protein
MFHMKIDRSQHWRLRKGISAVCEAHGTIFRYVTDTFFVDDTKSAFFKTVLYASE